MTTTNLEIRADARSVKQAGSLIRDAFRHGAVEAVKLRRKTSELNKEFGDVYKAQGRLLRELKRTREGTAEFARLNLELKETERRLDNLAKKQDRLNQRQEKGRRGAKLARGMATRGGQIGASVGASATQIAGALGQGATQPFGAMAGITSALGNVAAQIPIVGPMMAMDMAFTAAGLQIRQSRANQAIAYEQARSGATPFAAIGDAYSLTQRAPGMVSAFGAQGAVGKLSAIGQAMGGAARADAQAANFATLGLGPGAFGLGRIFGVGGGAGRFGNRNMAGGIISSEGEQRSVIYGAVAGAVRETANDITVRQGMDFVSPQKVEEYLQKMTSYLQGIADEGIEIDPSTVNAQVSAFRDGFQGIAEQFDLNQQLLSGQRIFNLMDRMNTGAKTGGLLGFVQMQQLMKHGTGTGVAGGTTGRGLGVMDALFYSQLGVGAGRGQLPPHLMVQGLQNMFGGAVAGGGKFGEAGSVTLQDLLLSQQMGAADAFAINRMKGLMPIGAVNDNIQGAVPGMERIINKWGEANMIAAREITEGDFDREAYLGMANEFQSMATELAGASSEGWDRAMGMMGGIVTLVEVIVDIFESMALAVFELIKSAMEFFGASKSSIAVLDSAISASKGFIKQGRGAIKSARSVTKLSFVKPPAKPKLGGSTGDRRRVKGWKRKSGGKKGVTGRGMGRTGRGGMPR